MTLSGATDPEPAPSGDAAAGAPWLLYGAYGFTGRLLAQEAVARGHRPMLAGRDPERVEALAVEMGLPGRAFPLDDREALRRGLEGMRLVLHAAGPFAFTFRPMVEACLAASVHYLDVTGEPRVLEEILGRDAEARERGVVLLPGVGMDVVPTDAVAALLAARRPDADALELALHTSGSLSPGTARTVLDHLPEGLLVRRGDRLIRARPGAREFRREVDFGPGLGVRSVAPYTWGDLATAPRTTGIPNVTCYMATSPRSVRLLPIGLPVLRAALSIGPLRRWAQRIAASRVRGPDDHTRKTARTRVWGRATGPDGTYEEAALETMEGYRFTGVAGIRAVEEVLSRTAPGRPDPIRGALTPAGAFGAKWALALPETRLV